MSTTLLAGNALRTPSVPGAQLRVGQGTLHPGAVLRTPYVPGALLTVASDSERISAVLYDRADLSVGTPLPLSFDRSWQDPISEAGAFSITLPPGDDALPAFQDDGRDIVGLYYRGVLAFLGSCTRRNAELVGKRSGRQVTYSGLGALGLFAKARVGPTGGGGRSPIEEDRHLGWPVNSYAHESWSTAEVLGDINHAIDVLAYNIQADPADVAAVVRQNLPFTGLIPVLGPPGSSMSLDAPVGDWYGYEDETTNATLTIAENGDYVVWFGPVDDEGELYVNGQQVCQISGANAFGVTSAAVTISAGPISVAYHVRNLSFESPNPTKVSWQITTEPTAATLVDPGGNSTLIAYPSGDAKVLAYPSQPPGQTITKSIRLLKAEAQARGVPVLADIDLDFTDGAYSDGVPASTVPDLATKVATDLHQFLLEVAATYVDLRMVLRSGRLALQVFEKGTMGGNVVVALDETNLLSLTTESELHGATKAWVRWDGGWTYLDTGDGDETAIEIGAPFSIEEVQRMSVAALGEVNEPKTQYTATMATPVSTTDAPYVAFRGGDTLADPSERVVALGMSEDGNGLPLPVVTLKDRISSPEARQAQELAKL
jgi:hypothetical protein